MIVQGVIKENTYVAWLPNEKLTKQDQQCANCFRSNIFLEICGLT